jgi:hypothetical protein
VAVSAQSDAIAGEEFDPVIAPAEREVLRVCVVGAIGWEKWDAFRLLVDALTRCELDVLVRVTGERSLSVWAVRREEAE